jgi:hypothetical protein
MVSEFRKRGTASAIRIHPDLHIRACGVPPRKSVETLRAEADLKMPPGTSIVLI